MITAVYSGDDNFASSQSTDPNGSSASVNVVGETLSLDCSGETLFEGDVGSVSGTVSNLDGAAFTVEVDWGDGHNGQPDIEDFYFSAVPDSPPASFSVNHIFMLDSTAGQVTVTAYGVSGNYAWTQASETYTISVTVFPTDTADDRQATGGASVTVIDPGPRTMVFSNMPSDPVYSNWPDPFSATATAYEAWNPSPGMTYEWIAPDGSQMCEGATCNDIEWVYMPGVGVYATDANGAASKFYFIPWVNTLPDEPTVSISETDPNQPVLGGGYADFNIHADAGSSQPTAPVTVFYSTMDPSGVAPRAYGSTYGPAEVTFQTTDFEQDESGHWVADVAVSIETTSEIFDGASVPLTVQLSHPYFCQLATATATATIQEPQLKIYLTDAEHMEPILISAGGDPVNVKVGETVTLYAFTSDGAPVGPTWTLPGNGEVIESYNPNLPDDQLTLLGQSGGCGDNTSRVVANAHSFDFEWVGAGSFCVTATVGVASVNASFNVQAPNVTVTATPTPPTQAQIAAGVTVVSGTTITPLTAANTRDDLAMCQLQWQGSTPPGWLYCYAQTIDHDYHYTVPAGNSFARGEGLAPGTYAPTGPHAGLDGGFPYGGSIFPPGPPDEADSPGLPIYRGVGGKSVEYLQATTYYMCKPVDSTGNAIGEWAPLAELSWAYYVSATWDAGVTPTIISSVGRAFGVAWSDFGTYPASNFRATTTFPQWNART